MILYTEVAAWITRAAILTFWFSGALMGDVIDTPQASGFVHGFSQRYFLLVLAGVFLNLILSGSPNLKSPKRPDNLIYYGEFRVTNFKTILFLLQGTKVNNVTRNIVRLNGIKRIFITDNGNGLYVEDIEQNIQDKFYLLISILMLLMAPGVMLGFYMFLESLFYTINIPVVIVGSVLKYFTFTILTYFLFPYTITHRRYLESSVRVFSKYMFNVYGYPVFTSPLIGFLRPNFKFIGLADPQKRIFVNSAYVKNNTLLNYIVAHEAGHLSNKASKRIKTLLVPVIFPLIVFVLFVIKIYLNYINLTHQAATFEIIVLALLVIVVISWLKLSRKEEEKADDFAVHNLGVRSVIKALYELKTENSSNISYKLSIISEAVEFDKKIERIKKKWGG